MTVTDQETAPQKDVTVIVKSDLGGTAQGQTNKDGELTVPAADSAYTDDTGTAVVGQYTVIVTDTAEKPVKDALVTLLAGEDGEKDAFTVLLPDGRLLDGNDQTVVTVLLPTAKPATGLNVEVSDEQRNHAARDTDKKGQITVPDASGSAGEIIGTDTGDEDKSNTVNVDVTDQDGKPVDGAEIGVDKDGAVSVTLPDDFTFDEDGPVTVTITDNQGEAKPGVSVTVEDGDGTTAAGETGKEGKVTLPAAYHFAYLVGYRDGTIGPNRNMTRGEAAAVFARVLSEARGDELEGLRRSRFPDVRRDAWYADYVAYLEKLGVVVGYPCLTVQAFQVVCQLLEFAAGVTNRKWFCYHFSKRTEDRHHALSFGNIDPCNIVHIDRSSSWICFGDQPFHHCRSNLFDDTGAPRRWLNLHKSNAANERLADGLHYGRYGPWRNTSGQDSLILTALATMRKKTRLAAVP